MRKIMPLLLSCAVALFCTIPLAAAINVGDKAPGFALLSTTGEKVTLSSVLAGNKPVIISFFATWCKPCLKELPHLQNLQAQGKVNVYLINIDEQNNGAVTEFLKTNGITLPTLLDPAAAITGDSYDVLNGGMARIPKLFLLSPSGIIKYIANGFDENVEEVIGKNISLIQEAMARRPKELAIFFTNSANGYLESCDCPTHPYGGLVRRATYFKQQRLIYPDALMLDSGDFFKPYTSEKLATTIMKIFDLLKYDAVCPGDQEFSFAKFPEMIGSYKIPFLASNVSICDGGSCKTITQSSMIINKRGVRILLVSAIHPDVFMLYPEDITKHISILPYKDMLSGILQRATGTYDLAILLSHSGDDADKQIAAEVPGFDIIVGGHSQTLIKEPAKVGKTFIVQAGPDAQNVGKFVLTFDENKQIASYQYEVIPLTKDIPDDPEIRALIDEYKNSLKTK